MVRKLCSFMLASAAFAAAALQAIQPVAAAPATVALAERWHLGPGISIARPAVLGDRAFVADGNSIAAYTLHTGAPLWTTSITDPTFGTAFIGRPTIVGGQVAAPVSVPGGAGYFSFDPATGAPSGNIGFHQIAGPISADGAAVASLTGSYGSGVGPLVLLAFGGRLYFVTFGAPAPNDSAISGGRAFTVLGAAVNGYDPSGPCIPLPIPNPPPYCAANWITAVTGTAQLPSFAGSGRIAVADSSGVVTVLDAVSGAPVFITTGAGTPLSPTAYGHGSVFAAGGDGVLRAYSAAGCATPPCTPAWTAPIGASSSMAPTVRGGRVYVATADGRVVVFAAGGCGAPSCPAIAEGDSLSGKAATARPVVRGGIVLATFGDELHAFGTG